VYVIEDVHWIDEISESLLADFLSVVAQTRSLVLITYRPEYGGALSHTPGAQTIGLAPLDNSQTVALITELLGTDPSVDGLTVQIAERAAGNPFLPRRSCATSPTAGCSEVCAAHTSDRRILPTSVCRPRCRRP
jgi:predicted ATPase